MHGSSYSYPILPTAVSSPHQSPLHPYPAMHWNQWQPPPQPFIQDYSRPPPPFPGSSMGFAPHQGMPGPFAYQSGSQNNANYYSPTRQYYNNYNYDEFGPVVNTWHKNKKRYRRPRPALDIIYTDRNASHAKKKKRQMSRNVQNKRGWTRENAKEAIKTEKEVLSSLRNHSLLIKFPDPELNKEMISKFHPSITSVHFQEPSTPRFCFVTVEDNTDIDKVIADLNKVPFGDGYITAECKKDKEEEQTIQPEDIDPLSLYVGNLPVEMTKEDVMKIYPKCYRVELEYAMKCTRYAFVSFHNLEACVEAFKRTHNMELRSKNLNVRFRRIYNVPHKPNELSRDNQPECSIQIPFTSMHDTVVSNDDAGSVVTKTSGVSLRVAGFDSTKRDPKLNDEIKAKGTIIKDSASTVSTSSSIEQKLIIKIEDDHQTSGSKNVKHSNEKADANKVAAKEEPIYVIDSDESSSSSVCFQEHSEDPEEDDPEDDDSDDRADGATIEEVTDFDRVFDNMISNDNAFSLFRDRTS